MIVLPNVHFTRLIASHPVLLLSSRRGRQNNLAPVTWYAPLSSNPPMIGLSLKPSTMSYQCIRESGDFLLGIPHEPFLRAVHFCGVHSGRDMDKMRHLNLTFSQSKAVSPLLLTECVANIECRVRDVFPCGDRSWITGEVLALTANPKYFIEDLLPGVQLIHYLGGNTYRIGDRLCDMSDIKPGYVPSDSML